MKLCDQMKYVRMKLAESQEFLPNEPGVSYWAVSRREREK